MADIKAILAAGAVEAEAKRERDRVHLEAWNRTTRLWNAKERLRNTGIDLYCIETGRPRTDDRSASYFNWVAARIVEFCKVLVADKWLQEYQALACDTHQKELAAALIEKGVTGKTKSVAKLLLAIPEGTGIESLYEGTMVWLLWGAQPWEYLISVERARLQPRAAANHQEPAAILDADPDGQLPKPNKETLAIINFMNKGADNDAVAERFSKGVAAVRQIRSRYKHLIEMKRDAL